MDLEIRRIVNVGEYNRERIIISVKNSVDIGSFILACTKRKEKSISSKIRNPFWFPDKVMNEGDLVVVYSKKGVNRVQENDDGSKTYFLYWNLSTPLWNQDEIPVLLEVAGWTLQDD